ncbi:hypothetical protein F4677DRAFT_299040 [Hypoxylon crocopeplum]|nr:hypothetical protein F4677DRAFT_299040 [Hypoxylon crocopeplum]
MRNPLLVQFSGSSVTYPHALQSPQGISSAAYQWFECTFWSSGGDSTNCATIPVWENLWAYNLYVKPHQHRKTSHVHTDGMPNLQSSSRLSSFQGRSIIRCSLRFRAKTQLASLMCTEHTAECPVCGKQYLIYVEFCKDYHPPLLRCPRGIDKTNEDMQEGRCPSPVCPYSRTGGCSVS